MEFCLKIIFVTSMLYCSVANCSEMQKKIAEATFSYETPKQCLKNAKQYVAKTFGKNAILFLEISNSVLRYKTLNVSIKHENTTGLIQLKNNEVAIFFNRSF